MGSSVAAGGFESEVGQELVRMNQVYDWLGERFEERKRELAAALENMKEYLEEVSAVERVVVEAEKAVKEVFGVDRLDEGRIRMGTTSAEVGRVSERSGKVRERIGRETEAALEKLKSKYLAFLYFYLEF